MDITPADKYKKLIRFALWFIYKKSGKTKEFISEDMKHCGNDVIRKMMNKINEGLNEIKEEPQRNRTREVAEFMLWIMYKDTAYRQPFFYILNEIIKDKDIFKGMNNFIVEPKNWYVNQWHDSKAMTDKQRKEGKITDGELSQCELTYVPDVQNKRFKKEYEEIEKARKRWW